MGPSVSGAFEEPDHATPLSPEERAGLKLAHITLREQLNEVEQQNIALAVSWAGSRKHNPVREPFGRGLHRRMFGDVWTWAGEYRTSNKNLGAEHGMIVPRLYDVFEQISFWVAHQTFTPDEIAIRFHHSLVVVHPFSGNKKCRLANANEAGLTSMIVVLRPALSSMVANVPPPQPIRTILRA